MGCTWLCHGSRSVQRSPSLHVGIDVKGVHTLEELKLADLSTSSSEAKHAGGHCVHFLPVPKGMTKVHNVCRSITHQRFHVLRIHTQSR